MKTTRRTFLQGIAANAVALTTARGEDGVNPSPMRLELEESLEQAGFDPTAPDCALLAVISDAHIFLGAEFPQYRTNNYDDGLIEEINSLTGLVSELVMAGDLITYHSMTPGLPATAAHRAWAEEEYAVAKAEMTRFNYRTWIVPGNHDTISTEANADLFQASMGVPPYQRTTFGGMTVFLLNSGNAGMLDGIQEAWLRVEVADLSPTEEVMIVVHIPPMTSMWTQAGVKRILADVFKGHLSRIWVISGHNHKFSESRFALEGAEFIQMQVTSASSLPWAFGDSRNPGYALIGIRQGRVVYRMFRSMEDSGFESRPPVSSLNPEEVRYVFDGLPYLLSTFEEGFYDRSGIVTELNGIDVGCYITYCKKITIQIVPGQYLGTISSIVIAGILPPLDLPRCSVSLTGDAGSWVPVSSPPGSGGGLFRYEIPDEFRDAESFFIKFEADNRGPASGFSISGWALSSDDDGMTAYEKWLLRTYGSLRLEERIRPESVTPGTEHANIVNFGFNLGASHSSEVSGLPRLGPATEEGMRGLWTKLTFARMSSDARPGIEYLIERSDDLESWESLPVEDVVERIVDQWDEWEEVEIHIRCRQTASESYRVGLYPMPTVR